MRRCPRSPTRGRPSNTRAHREQHCLAASHSQVRSCGRNGSTGASDAYSLTIAGAQAGLRSLNYGKPDPVVAPASWTLGPRPRSSRSRLARGSSPTAPSESRPGPSCATGSTTTRTTALRQKVRSALTRRGTRQICSGAPPSRGPVRHSPRRGPRRRPSLRHAFRPAQGWRSRRPRGPCPVASRGSRTLQRRSAAGRSTLGRSARRL